MFAIRSTSTVLSFASLFLVICVFSSASQAQLNFSPGWGKRAELGNHSPFSMLDGSSAHRSAAGLRSPQELSDVARLDQDDVGGLINDALNGCNGISISTMMKIFRLIKVRYFITYYLSVSNPIYNISDAIVHR